MSERNYYSKGMMLYTSDINRKSEEYNELSIYTPIVQFVHFEDIVYISSKTVKPNYKEVVTTNGTFYTNMNFEALLAKLPQYIFEKVSKSYIVNLTKPVSINRDGDMLIPIVNSPNYIPIAINISIDNLEFMINRARCL